MCNQRNYLGNRMLSKNRTFHHKISAVWQQLTWKRFTVCNSFKFRLVEFFVLISLKQNSLCKQCSEHTWVSLNSNLTKVFARAKGGATQTHFIPGQ